jgi:anti-sigma factor RsiW
MTCAQARPLLGAHLDNELDVRSSLELEEHLRECAGCRAELADLRTLQESARAHLTRFAPSPALEARLATAVRGPRRPRRAWLAGAGAAMFAAAAALFLLFLRPGDGNGRPLGDEIVDAHTRSLQAHHLTDVLSSDQHTVKPWFNGKIAFGVPVSDFTAAGFPLVGGRLDYVGGREVAALVYHRRNHTVNVFVWPETADAAPTELAERGYAVLHYARGGLAWWLVSDASPADLRELQGLLAELR